MEENRKQYSILCDDPHLGLNLPALWFEMPADKDLHVYACRILLAPVALISLSVLVALWDTNERDVKRYCR